MGEKEKETEIRIEKLKSKERQDKMQHILEALKANNNHPEERKKWEQKLAELKPMMSSSQAKLAEAEHEQLVAQREVQVAKEQEEKQAAEKTKKAEDKAVALEAQMAADKKATELAQEEMRRADRALEEQVRLTAMMSNEESKSKGEAKVEELKEKDRER